MDLQTIVALLGSGVIVAIITAVFSKMTSDKNVRIENITKERTKWRESMRDLVMQTNAAFEAKNQVKLNEIKAALVVRLNPGDPNDAVIINSIEQLPHGWDRQQLNKFTHQMAGLLKHDWERVKIESSRIMWPPTFAVSALAVTVSSAFIVWATRCNYLMKAPARYVLAVGAVLSAVFYLVSLVNGHLIELDKQKLKRQRSTEWQLGWKTLK